MDTIKKRKTYEEMFGIVRAKEIKDKLKIVRKGKTYLEIYGKKRGDEVKKLQSNARKGKTLEEFLGVEKAKNAKLKLSNTNKGKRNYISPEKEKIRREKIKFFNQIPKEKIIKEFLEKFNSQPFQKSHWEKYMNIGTIPVKRIWGSLDEFAKYLKIEFKKPDNKKFGHNGHIGKLEQEAYNEYINKNPTNDIIQQYYTGKYFIDWYDKTINTAFEFDEPNHKQQVIKDFIRQKHIEKTLNCNVIRIEQKEWLHQKQQLKICDFVGES
jgi:hypothetical protein